MKSKKAIEEAIIAEIATILAMDENDITPKTPLASVGIDSIRLIEIFIFIEKEYGIRLIDAGLDRESLQNASSLASCIASALEKHEREDESETL